MIMIVHPPIVKIVVPIPPVDGRDASVALVKPYGLLTPSSVVVEVVVFTVKLLSKLGVTFSEYLYFVE